MSDVVGKLWGFCNTLRHDGINYGDYIEQLTCLLFLKLADEKGVPLPAGCGWKSLRAKAGTELLDHYVEVLRTLSREKVILKDIFAGSLSKFREPVNLKKLIGLIDETEWTVLDVDLKAQAYEGLLQKYAAEQKGAGQYFTPRVAIRCVVRCMKPDIRESSDFSIHDPALGTAGFLIGAYEWMMKQTHEGADLRREDRERLQKRTFSGGEIVLETRRLALMNLYLHEIEADTYYGDSLAEGPHLNKRYDCVMTNPPFGKKGASEVPSREDFTVKTSNKQLNFLQHVLTVLKPGGRAAIVLPDNVLFEKHAPCEVRKILLKDCYLHTILRLPIGTFTPYSPGVKANILFFQKGLPTEETWIYDLRTNVKKMTKKHPLTDEHLEDFEICYHAKPRVETERFKKFSIDDIVRRGFNLHVIWLKDESYIDPNSLPDPAVLVGETLTNLGIALDAMKSAASRLENRNIAQTRGEIPKGWVWARIRETCKVIGGGTPDTSNPGYWNGNIPWITSADIYGLRDIRLRRKITQKGLEDSAANLLPKGNLVVVTRVGLGKIAINDFDLCFNQDSQGIIVNRTLFVPEYLLYFLSQEIQRFKYESRGTTIDGVTKDQLMEIVVPTPPLREQEGIVALINELFSLANRTRIASKKAAEQSEVIDHAVLAKAFRGELVPQDPKHEPA